MCVVFTTSAIYLYCIAYKRVCSLYLFASLQASTHLISRHTLLGSLGADSVCPVDNPAIFFKNCGSQNGSIVLLIYLFFLAAVCIWNLKKKQLWMSKTHAQEAQGCQRNNPIFSLQVTENYTHGEHIKDHYLVLYSPRKASESTPVRLPNWLLRGMVGSFRKLWALRFSWSTQIQLLGTEITTEKKIQSWLPFLTVNVIDDRLGPTAGRTTSVPPQ